MSTANSRNIGVLGFSASINPGAYKEALEYLSSRQVQVTAPFDPSVNYGRDTHLFSSASADERLQGFSQLLGDPQVQAIVAARGAYGSMELLERLNFAAYAQRPLIVSGLSDVTALLLALYCKVPGARCVHGPSVLSGFSKASKSQEARESAEALLALIDGVYRPAPVQLVACGGCLNTKGIEGALLGGNLSMVASLVGTSWLPSAQGSIVFFEEIGERPFRIHRMLLQLRLAGFFNGVRGVVLGDFLNCAHPQGLGPDVEKVVADIFRDAEFPVFRGLPCGHGDKNLPILLGALGHISTKGILTIKL